jgi:hypothetical protein
MTQHQRFLTKHHLGRFSWLYLGEDFLLLSGDEKSNMYLPFSAFTYQQTTLVHFNITQKHKRSIFFHHSSSVLYGHTDGQRQTDRQTVRQLEIPDGI